MGIVINGLGRSVTPSASKMTEDACPVKFCLEVKARVGFQHKIGGVMRLRTGIELKTRMHGGQHGVSLVFKLRQSGGDFQGQGRRLGWPDLSAGKPIRTMYVNTAGVEGEGCGV